MLDFRADLTGRFVVITGAAGIFGSWLATAFADAGAELLLTDARADEVSAVAERVGARWVAADLSTGDGLARVTAAMTEGGRAPYALVNNAGVYPRSPLESTTPDDVRKVLDINVTAPYELARQACLAMIEHDVRGSVVNISSGAAVRASKTGSIYSASKAALESLTRSLALEVATHGIRVNTVQPGFAPGSEVSALSEDHIKRMLGRIPLGRTSGPEDMPGAVLWLCSSAASFVTAATIAVDGGRTAGDYNAEAS